MNELLVKKIEAGIRSIRLKIKTPQEVELTDYFNRLYKTNEGLYYDLIAKYQGVLNDYEKSTK